MRHDVRDGRLVRAAHAGRRLAGALLAWHGLVIGVPALASNAGAQISPGPLSAAHGSLDSPLSCTKCHGGGKESMTAKCTACHREISWLAERNRGFHARAGRADCASCHPDHAGRDFALVKWPDGSARQFDHARAGWALEDKHARLACEKCHTEKLRVSPVAALSPRRTGARWIGLETNCVSCHEDVHKGSLDRSCETCHTAAGWSPAPKFEHARTKYPLTGKHADVTCEKCHTTADRRAGDSKLAVAQLKPLAHGDCASCHRDPHAGRLRGTCSSCHVTTSFTSVEGRSFSHDQTRYPLTGRHASVSCAACHTGYPAKIDRPQFATCAACHSDPHKGQATIRGAAVDCASCHTVAGFSPSTFTVAQHARTAYPLEGKHAWVSCAGCHTRTTSARGAREVVMRPAAARCESCHADAHGGQLASRAGGAACATCHTSAGWKPSTFGVREHASLHFSLTGRHAAIDCASCHASSRRGLPALPATRAIGTAKVALHLDETTCDACHRDPHGGRYVAAVSPGEPACVSCHDTRAFRPSTVGAEAHSRFAFALEGAHRAAPCSACHSTMKRASLGASLKLSPAPTTPVSYAIPGATCATCHGTPHGTQFAARPDSGACQSCHDLNSWSPASRFVHDANGGFTLGAAHARVPCARCHVQAAGAASGAARTWHGVPRTCESCHRNGGPRT
jgi:hypothetical protein